MERCHRAPQEQQAGGVDTSVRLEAAAMAGSFTQILIVAAVFHFALRGDDRTMKVTEELLHQHEEQRSREMAWLLEMEQRSQESPEITQESLLLSACGHWWFWASADMLLAIFAFYWLPRWGGSGSDSSAGGEPPAEVQPRRKRRRRRRKRMCGMADCTDKLDQIKSSDQHLEWKDMQNSEEDMKGMTNASTKPFPQKIFGQSCIQGIE